MFQSHFSCSGLRSANSRPNLLVRKPILLRIDEHLCSHIFSKRDEYNIYYSAHLSSNKKIQSAANVVLLLEASPTGSTEKKSNSISKFHS